MTSSSKPPMLSRRSSVGLMASAPIAALAPTTPDDVVTPLLIPPPHGVDVSKWQGNVDFGALVRDGTSFAFLKATEGQDYTDPRFIDNARNAMYAGLVVGAYHYGRVSDGGTVSGYNDACLESVDLVNAMANARMMSADMTTVEGVLPPVLDIEWDSTAMRHSRGKVTMWVLSFIVKIHSMTGQLPIIYTGPNFARHRLDLGISMDGIRITDCPLWLARHGTGPLPTKTIPRWPWTFWQHSSTNLRPDTGAGRIDANVFNGTHAELLEMAG